MGFSGGSEGKEPAWNAGDRGSALVVKPGAPTFSEGLPTCLRPNSLRLPTQATGKWPPLARSPSRFHRGRSRFRPAQTALVAPRATESCAPPARPRPAPSRGRSPQPGRPHPALGQLGVSQLLATQRTQLRPKYSLDMSAAEAGGVFHRARGRTLDAFSSGTSCWGVGGFRAAEHSARGTLGWDVHLQPEPSGGCTPGAGDRNSNRTSRTWGFQGLL